MVLLKASDLTAAKGATDTAAGKVRFFSDSQENKMY